MQIVNSQLGCSIAANLSLKRVTTISNKNEKGEPIGSPSILYFYP